MQESRASDVPLGPRLRGGDETVERSYSRFSMKTLVAIACGGIAR